MVRVPRVLEKRASARKPLATNVALRVQYSSVAVLARTSQVALELLGTHQLQLVRKGGAGLQTQLARAASVPLLPEVHNDLVQVDLLLMATLFLALETQLLLHTRRGLQLLSHDSVPFLRLDRSLLSDPYQAVGLAAECTVVVTGHARSHRARVTHLSAAATAVRVYVKSDGLTAESTG